MFGRFLQVVGVLALIVWGGSWWFHHSDIGKNAGKAQFEAQKEAALKNYVDDIRRKAPMMLNDVVRLDTVDYQDKVLVFKTTILGKGLIISDEKKDKVKKAMISMYCEEDNKVLPNNDVKMDVSFRYQVSAWDYDTFAVKMTPSNC